ncbi:MAG TPA: type II toxin-antitoxin system prevent-host-death family antitoxin [Bryobacteraceae bacterium]|nr:type II toxin-antitoxin system prevent-host-death family antitoxin [Bryobacteraceae bacterium]
MIKTLTAIKARQNLGEVLEEVYYNGDQFIIERAGKPMAAVVPLWQVQARKKHQERVFGMLDKLWEAPPAAQPATIAREVSEAMRAVRPGLPRTAGSKPVRKKA